MVRKPTTRPALTNAKPDNALDRTEDMPAAKQHAPLSPANKTPLQPLSRKELVFIDQGVDDYPTLIAGVKEGVDIHLIDPTRDGVLQITAILKQQTDISAVHIVSHGNVGYLALGNSVLSTETLTHYQDALFSWRQALDSDADILIYGCNVGKGLSGEAFIQRLALLTGTNIAASNNLTGHYKLGGNWQLAYQQGHIKASFPFEAETTQLYSFEALAKLSRASREKVRHLLIKAKFFEQSFCFCVVTRLYHRFFQNLDIPIPSTVKIDD